ncbi:MAG: TolC family protein, partial [Planctomycetaceae bacterium]
MRSSFLLRGCLLVLIGSACLAGCSRTRYRQSADRDSYALLDDRLDQTPWHPSGMSIDPEGRSRLYDPTDPDCTPLPDSEPRLYGYEIPPLDSDTDPRSWNPRRDTDRPGPDSSPIAPGSTDANGNPLPPVPSQRTGAPTPDDTAPPPAPAADLPPGLNSQGRRSSPNRVTSARPEIASGESRRMAPGLGGSEATTAAAPRTAVLNSKATQTPGAKADSLSGPALDAATAGSTPGTKPHTSPAATPLTGPGTAPRAIPRLQRRLEPPQSGATPAKAATLGAIASGTATPTADWGELEGQPRDKQPQGEASTSSPAAVSRVNRTVQPVAALVPQAGTSTAAAEVPAPLDGRDSETATDPQTEPTTDAATDAVSESTEASVPGTAGVGNRSAAAPSEAAPPSAPTALVPSQVRPSQWEALPLSVQQRMLEFEQLQRVYRQSFEDAPTEELQPTGRVLTLENIIELGQLNSRELQTQKETLYKAALAVSLEQFQYLLKFTPFGNGGDLAYRTRNFDSDYFSTLDNRAHAEVDKLLVTGGTFVGRLANNVLLTFNGPDAFAADVSSQLLFDISQPLIQRDIRFEPLTRAERQLVYAARSYLRFRKTFFVNLASSYYAILRAYRQIAIESQNYFSLSGAHQQSLIELEAGLRSRIQTEQIEQNMLTGRSRLIAAGVTLERALDRLKIDMGVPPELAIRIDLQELDEVTGRDETSVAAEAVRRTRERLVAEQIRGGAQLPLLVNAALVLQQRLQQWRASSNARRAPSSSSGANPRSPASPSRDSRDSRHCCSRCCSTRAAFTSSGSWAPPRICSATRR